MRWLAVAHHLPERTRLRTPLLRRDLALCERVADAVSALPGVHAVHVRPYTGSVLVEHEPDVATAAILDVTSRVLDHPRLLAIGERPPLDPDVPPLSTVARKLVATVREIDRDVRRATSGSVDLGTLAMLGFVGVSAAEIIATGRLPMPPWFNLTWWGFRTFVTTEEEEIRAEADNGPVR